MRNIIHKFETLRTAVAESFVQMSPEMRDLVATRVTEKGDALEIATRMLAGERATYAGPVSSVHGAINVPRGLQEPRIPIIVGGNGRNVTFRYAARFADELNLVFLDPDGVADAIPVADQAKVAAVVALLRGLPAAG